MAALPSRPCASAPASPPSRHAPHACRTPRAACRVPRPASWRWRVCARMGGWMRALEGARGVRQCARMDSTHRTRVRHVDAASSSKGHVRDLLRETYCSRKRDLLRAGGRARRTDRPRCCPPCPRPSSTPSIPPVLHMAAKRTHVRVQLSAATRGRLPPTPASRTAWHPGPQAHRRTRQDCRLHRSFDSPTLTA